MSTLQIMREGAGLSQEQMAEKAKISRETINRYERGVRNIQTANLSTLTRIADVLSLNVDGFIAALNDEDLAQSIACTLKIKSACIGAAFHNGPTTVEAICELLPEGAVSRLSVPDLREMMETVNRAFHAGRHFAEQRRGE